jgi:DNA-binding CsgD family transcriptional regulator
MTQCPVSGLSVTEKEHWSFEHRQGNYIRKYSLIGTDIIHVQEIADHDIIPESLFAEDFQSLINEENLSGNPLYLLMDCSPVADLKYSYKKDFMTLLANPDSDFRLVALYNFKPAMRLQFEMFQSLATEIRPVILAGSYEDAVKSILDIKSGKVDLTTGEAGPESLTEAALKKEFLAKAGNMLLSKQFDQSIFLPPTEHCSYPYFQILDLMQRDMSAIEDEHLQNTERIEQEFRTLLASKNTLLDSQIELSKKNEQLHKEELAACLARIAAQELETTRVSAANAEKIAALRSVFNLIESLDLDPSVKEQIDQSFSPLFETSSKANLVNTELTETDSVFISKLQKKHPSLNQRELRISLLIKLDYHSRDIARTLGLSTRGIESIRYRLHKKIGLDRHRSLKTYLTDLVTEES